MNETEKIKFIGYDIEGNKIDRTISGVRDRYTLGVERKYSPRMALPDCNFTCFREPPKMDKEYSVVKVIIKKIFGDFEEEETILLNGIAYVMNQNGTTVDAIKSGR